MAMMMGVIVEPGRPVGPLVISDVRADSVHLSWKPPSEDGGGDILGYVIEAKDFLHTDIHKTYIWSDGSQTEYEVTGLQTSHIYQFRVYAQNEAGRGEALLNKNVVRIKAVSKKPPSPSKPSVEMQDDESVLLRWTVPDGFPDVNYIVERYEAKSDLWMQCNHELVMRTSYLVTGLVQGKKYRFRVTAENAHGMSRPGEESDPIELKEYEGEPPTVIVPLADCLAKSEAPALFSCEYRGTQPIVVNWSKDGIRVRDGFGTSVVTEMSKSTLTIEEVESDDDDCVVQCDLRNSEGKASSQAKIILLCPPKLTCPSSYTDGLTFDEGDNLRLKVTHKGRPLPTVRVLFRDRELPLDDRAEVSLLDEATEVRIRGLQHQDSGLYEFVAANEVGKDILPVRVTVAGPPSPPAGFPSVEVTSEGQYFLKWEDPLSDGGSCIFNYIVEILKVESKEWVWFATVHDSFLNINDKTSLETSDFRIRAENIYGTSDPSEEYRWYSTVSDDIKLKGDLQVSVEACKAGEAEEDIHPAIEEVDTERTALELYDDTFTKEAGEAEEDIRPAIEEVDTERIALELYDDTFTKEAEGDIHPAIEEVDTERTALDLYDTFTKDAEKDIHPAIEEVDTERTALELYDDTLTKDAGEAEEDIHPAIEEYTERAALELYDDTFTKNAGKIFEVENESDRTKEDAVIHTNIENIGSEGFVVDVKDEKNYDQTLLRLNILKEDDDILVKSKNLEAELLDDDGNTRNLDDDVPSITDDEEEKINRLETLDLKGDIPSNLSGEFEEISYLQERENSSGKSLELVIKDVKQAITTIEYYECELAPSFEVLYVESQHILSTPILNFASVDTYDFDEVRHFTISVTPLEEYLVQSIDHVLCYTNCSLTTSLSISELFYPPDLVTVESVDASSFSVQCIEHNLDNYLPLCYDDVSEEYNLEYNLEYMKDYSCCIPNSCDIAHSTENVLLEIFLSYLPNYVQSVWHLTYREAVFMSSYPYIFEHVPSFITDIIFKHNLSLEFELCYSIIVSEPVMLHSCINQDTDYGIIRANSVTYIPIELETLAGLKCVPMTSYKPALSVLPFTNVETKKERRKIVDNAVESDIAFETEKMALLRDYLSLKEQDLCSNIPHSCAECGSNTLCLCDLKDDIAGDFYDDVDNEISVNNVVLSVNDSDEKYQRFYDSGTVDATPNIPKWLRFDERWSSEADSTKENISPAKDSVTDGDVIKYEFKDRLNLAESVNDSDEKYLRFYDSGSIDSTPNIPKWLRFVSPFYLSSEDDFTKENNSDKSPANDLVTDTDTIKYEFKDRSVQDLLNLAEQVEKSFSQKAEHIESLESILQEELNSLEKDLEAVHKIHQTFLDDSDPTWIDSSHPLGPDPKSWDESKTAEVDLIDFQKDVPLTGSHEAKEMKLEEYAPQVITHLQNRVVQCGNRTRLYCSISGQPDPQIAWLKSGKLLPPSSRYVCSNLEEYGLYLDIFNAKSSDSGEYMCIATNCHGSAQTQAYVCVVGEREDSPEEPKFLTTPNDATVAEGENVVLEWKVSGTPVPHVIWFKNAERIQTSLRVDTFSNHRGCCRLVLHDVTPDDAAIYTCYLDNEAGSALSTVQVTVRTDRVLPNCDKPTEPDWTVIDNLMPQQSEDKYIPSLKYHENFLHEHGPKRFYGVLEKAETDIPEKKLPGLPFAPKILNTGKTWTMLSWSSPVDRIMKRNDLTYRIEKRLVDGTRWKEVARTRFTVYTVAGLKSGQSYMFRISAGNKDGWGPPVHMMDSVHCTGDRKPTTKYYTDQILEM